MWKRRIRLRRVTRACNRRRWTNIPEPLRIPWHERMRATIRLLKRGLGESKFTPLPFREDPVCIVPPWVAYAAKAGFMLPWSVLNFFHTPLASKEKMEWMQ